MITIMITAASAVILVIGVWLISRLHRASCCVRHTLRVSPSPVRLEGLRLHYAAPSSPSLPWPAPESKPSEPGSRLRTGSDQNARGRQMASGVFSPERAKIDQRTLRRDRWWIYPVITFIGFTGFVVYSAWRAFANTAYYASPYLSLFYFAMPQRRVRPGIVGLRYAVGFLPTWISPALRHPRSSTAAPADLLLLPQGVLPLLLAVASRVRRCRAAQEVRRRDALPADLPERAPLVLLRGRSRRARPHVRRGDRVPQRGARMGPRRTRARSSCSSTSS